MFLINTNYVIGQEKIDKRLDLREVVFSKKGNITNKEAYNESIITYKHLFEKALREYAKKDSLFSDEMSMNLEMKIQAIGFAIEEMQLTPKYKSSKSEITYLFQDSLPIVYKISRDFSITELKKDTKTIEGFKCFKVIFSVKEQSDNSNEISQDMPTILKEAILNTETEYIMYVTDKIKNCYHPVIKYKFVLDKYYPLEIIEKDSSIKGAQINYNLIRLELK